MVPTKWTEYHTHRLFHMSMVTVAGFLVLGMIFSYGILFTNVQAGQQTVTPPSTNVTVHVVNVNPGPITPIPGTPPANCCAALIPLTPGNLLNPNSSGKPPQNPAPTNLVNTPTVSIVPNANEGNYQDGTPNSTFIFQVAYPGFSGYTNIPKAEIFIKINSPDGAQEIKSTTRASADGLWHWKSPVPVRVGRHTILVHAQDGKVVTIFAENKLDFIIGSAVPPVTPTRPRGTGQPVAVLPQSKPDFNIFVEVPPRFKIIQPGDEFVTNIYLEGFGNPYKPQPLQLEYTVEDVTGAVVSDSFETVQIADNLSVGKIFYTHPDLAEGVYTVIVKAPTESIVATGYDTFEVRGRAIIPLSMYSKTDFTVVYQAFIAIMFLFLIVLYLEYNRVVILSRLIEHIDEQYLRGEVKQKTTKKS